MVIADFSGNFLNAENCHNEDIGVILSEGSNTKRKDKQGKEYTALDLEVEVNNKRLVYGVFSPVGRVLIKKWGNDTKNWVGKKFKCLIVNYTSYGVTKKRVDIEPIDYILD